MGRNLHDGPGEMSRKLALAGSEGMGTPRPGKLVGPSLGGECAVRMGAMLLETFLAVRASRLPRDGWASGRGGPRLLLKNHSMLKRWLGAAGDLRDKIQDAQLNSTSR